jgi:salicylate hydroxylase
MFEAITSLRMSGPFRIVIAGGGIAGLSAAIALRGPNRQIAVLEQSSLGKEIGALISLQPNASKILQSNWDLKNELHNAREMVDEGFRIYNTDGTLVNTIPLLAKTEYGSDRLLFHRKDLHDVLKDAAVSPDREGEPTILRLASRVVECDAVAGIVTLETGERIQADLIIGADGMRVPQDRNTLLCADQTITRHSVLRKYVLGSEPCAMPTGHSGGSSQVSMKQLNTDQELHSVSSDGLSKPSNWAFPS